MCYGLSAPDPSSSLSPCNHACAAQPTAPCLTLPLAATSYSFMPGCAGWALLAPDRAALMFTGDNPSPLLAAGQPPPPPASEMEVPHGHHQPPLPALPAQPPPGEALLQLAMQAEMGGHPVAMGQGQPMYDHNGQPVEQGMHPLAYGGGQLHSVFGLVLVGAGRLLWEAEHASVSAPIGLPCLGAAGGEEQFALCGT